jgi:hypothetical protein
MPLPAFDSRGDLPVGVHRATLAEVTARFGHGTPQREFVTSRLVRVYELAQRTRKLERFIIFGSYVTTKSDPNDVDIILVMADDFTEYDYDPVLFPIFEHLRAQQELGASIFAVRPGLVVGETVNDFIAYWQIKRDKSQHGIVEVILEVNQ